MANLGKLVSNLEWVTRRDGVSSVLADQRARNDEFQSFLRVQWLFALKGACPGERPGDLFDMVHTLIDKRIYLIDASPEEALKHLSRSDLDEIEIKCRHLPSKIVDTVRKWAQK